MSDALAGLLMQEQARSVRLEAERNRWAELAGEKEGEITTLRERLAEAHQLLQDALIYGCDGWWAKRLAAHLGWLRTACWLLTTPSLAAHGCGRLKPSLAQRTAQTYAPSSSVRCIASSR
jgi:hypothetical protein